ncbi:exodeoxyribonuclease VII large subunit [Pseudanabaena sp. PCC 6802]|uniref:exodeoxyribonuclease VII large subunit n=1 Tax=Pseudanabaena sp. PCC 6802 TaxID=118173 RepID=UPI0003478B41|nr:exodeoxyribonuclease VII large subunit [Pseudanabaena sp. PCC 6802]
MTDRQDSLTLSVSDLTHKITQLLKTEIGYVRVSGEISGFKVAYSGHRYFTLKDESAQIDCVLWHSRLVDFVIADGMMAIVTGQIAVYATRGKYQIDCHAIAPMGQGDLYLAFEALKRDLAEKGFFDPDRKRPLPVLPLRIGVVTSATGAAVQDILSTLARRSPHCRVYLCPAAVQGEAAPYEIANAIAALDRVNVDVAIVGRGGGSLEDLWAFNTATVAQAIYDSVVPIVAAVGHETDFTIADFVADVRAATPTAAAELVTQFHQLALMQLLHQNAERLYAGIQNAIVQRHQQIDSLSRSYAFQRFKDRLQNYAQQVDDAETSLRSDIRRCIDRSNSKLEAIASHAKSLHPLAPLKRGFALLEADGRAVKVDESLENCDRIAIIRQHEVAYVKIEQVQPGQGLNPLAEDWDINTNVEDSGI